MSVQIISKEKLPKIAKMNDGEIITQSAAQTDPHLADPHDFKVLKAEDGIGAPTPGHGQHGRSLEELQALLLRAAQDRGKSSFCGKKRKPEAKN